MDSTLLLFLAIGTVWMAIPIVWIGRFYKIALWRLLVSSVLLTVVGTVGARIMVYIETGSTGGISFYGAVFLVPIVFALIAYMLYVPYTQLLDLCAIGECAMLALMRVHCLIGGCCVGRVLFTMENGEPFRFPNRMAELILGILMMALLMLWAYRNPKRRGVLYAWYMVLYGSARFLLNFMREEWAQWDPSKRIPMGTIWSVVSVAVGVTWILLKMRHDKKVQSEAGEKSASVPVLKGKRR